MVSSGDFEDEDHRRFLRLEQRSGEPVILSRAALELSAFAAAASVRNDTPGFVGDDYLSADTSLTAIELVAAGQWVRVGRRYEITDPDERALLQRLHREQLEGDDWPKSPAECSDHMKGPNSRGRCCKCGTSLPLEDRIF
ncbi:hypothetical protein AWC12_01900 [Mycolicibacterium iranicum]|jgi:hypothetical protein|uniref:Uncharacterized protein n=1 Tax=Mycolicibacterium iranicum TaxID=912594 RepID=A0A1X1X2Q2_MYCIR|nr:hypothetical protein AWC12_01900 [Mycolicibacterium iranicum]